MKDKLVLNTNLICKADRFIPAKCAVEKVIEVSDSEFMTFSYYPMKENHYLPEYKDLMGYYDGAYHGVLFVNEQSGDGLFVNSEGYDYARYAQYIPNAREIVQAHEQTAVMDNLKKSMDVCIDGLVKQQSKDKEIRITLEDLFSDTDIAYAIIEYASEYVSNHPQIADCLPGLGVIEATSHELTETKLYCPLVFSMETEGGEYPYEVDPANYIRYTVKINEAIRQSLTLDEDEIKHGLNAYTHSEQLAKKVYSIFPGVEARNGELYGVFTIKSYGELEDTELAEITREMIGQAADGWGEGFEQHPLMLGGDEVCISFWNSDDDYFLKPESEVFPNQEISQTMGGLS